MKDYIKKTISFYDANVQDYYQKTVNLQKINWLTKFISYLPSGSYILDVGCAYGRDVKFFINNKFKTYGIDLSKEMIKKAKQYEPMAEFQVMDMTNLKFENNFFDGIWCSAALLHLNKKDGELALSQMKKVLKIGGYLFLDLKEGVGEKTFKDERYHNVEKFYSYYTENEIKTLLSKKGFKIVDFVVEKRILHDYQTDGKLYLIVKKTRT